MWIKFWETIRHHQRAKKLERILEFRIKLHSSQKIFMNKNQVLMLIFYINMRTVSVEILLFEILLEIKKIENWRIFRNSDNKNFENQSKESPKTEFSKKNFLCLLLFFFFLVKLYIVTASYRRYLHFFWKGKVYTFSKCVRLCACLTHIQVVTFTCADLALESLTISFEMIFFIHNFIIYICIYAEKKTI